jgi:hypothetical protein
MRYIILVIAIIAILSSGLLINGNAVSFPRDMLVLTTETGAHSLRIERADTAAQWSQGLMGRKKLHDTDGMLFVFPYARKVEMWMKDTPLSLDMLFIRDNGEIAHIARNTTPFSTDIIAAPEEVRAVLELEAGRAEKLAAKPGDKISHEAFKP